MSSMTARSLRPAAENFSRTACTLLATAAFMASVASPASAGDIKEPGDPTSQWSGGINDSWHVPANWTTGAVPGAGASAIVVGGPFNNIFLSGASANLGSLFVGGAKSVSTNGFQLEVMGAPAQTTIVGVDSAIFIPPIPGGSWGLRTQDLSVEMNGRLQMAGGRARVLDQLTLVSGGRITGHGIVEVFSPNPAAFNGLNGNDIVVSGGDLRISVSDGGSMALPGLNVLQAGRTLELIGPMFLPVPGGNLGPSSTLHVQNNWTLGGDLLASPGAGGTSFITGSGAMIADAQVGVANGGTLRIEAPVQFAAGGNTSLVPNATLELASIHEAVPGHQTVGSVNSRLRVEANQFLSDWSGDIVLTGGVLDLQNPSGFWLMDGTLQLAAFGGIRGRVQGSAALRHYGEVNVIGTGGAIEGELDMYAGSALHLAQENTRLMVDGTLRLRGSSQTDGPGALEVRSGGELFLGQPASVHSQILNGGELQIGVQTGQVAYAHVNAGYVQQSSGRFIMEIADVDPEQYDSVEFTGAAAIAGELELVLLNGYQAELGDQFTVMYAHGGVSGTFDALIAEPGYSVAYTPNAVIVTFDGVPTCPADVNGDGEVNLSDLLEVLASWGSCDGCSADITGDGNVDLTDLLQVLSAWGACSE